MTWYNTQNILKIPKTIRTHNKLRKVVVRVNIHKYVPFLYISSKHCKNEQNSIYNSILKAFPGGTVDKDLSRIPAMNKWESET